MRDRSAWPHIVEIDWVQPCLARILSEERQQSRRVYLRCRCWLHSKLYGFSPLIVHPPSHEFGPAGEIGANGPPVGVLLAKQTVDEV